MDIAAGSEDRAPLLELRNLSTHFFTDAGVVRAVDGVSFSILPGETVALVGESGCGKSLTAQSIINVVPRPGRIVGGEILYRRRNGKLVDCARLGANGRDMRELRGNEISMIFQEPMSSLNPVYTVGEQIGETLRLHAGLGRAEAREKTAEILARVGVSDPVRRIASYPHQLSGGLRQRVMISMAIACAPNLIIADEPTTALDVTIQAQILDLLRSLQEESRMALLLITHDLGVVSEMADRVAVMYLGQIVEFAPAQQLFAAPHHPYTRALLESIPVLGRTGRLNPIDGSVPMPLDIGSGCRFFSRCRAEGRREISSVEPPPVVQVGKQHWVRCSLHA